jgi:hypothetical protein
MKLTITLILILLSFKVFAQRLNGVITDKFTGLPIKNVNITTATSTTFTSVTEKFSLLKVHVGDTIKFSYVGYKPYYLVLNKIYPDTIQVYLEQNSILLKNVTINGINGYRIDSIRRRKEFASVFAYKSSGLKNIFIPKSPYVSVPYSYNTALNSTASIASINLLSAIGLLNKNKAPASKLQKALLKDEDDDYIDHIFSKVRVSTITTLKGDCLSEFLSRYRPSIKELKNMTDYDLIFYIKKSYQEFIKSIKHEDHSLFIK